MRLLFLCLLPAAMAVAEDSRFEPAINCALCHKQIRDAGQYTLWSRSMMSHASRDPYWRAKVQSEAAISPGIEDKCLRCHAPAQQYEHGRPMTLADLNGIGLEGVTCTVCHQIAPGNLGRPESWSGGFVISDSREIYGPHENPFQMPMRHHTQYTPVLGRHILDAALCATCHTVITHPVPGRDFVEQAPFLEWLASSYPKEGRTCQSCHVPPLAEPEYIAHRPPGGPFPPTRPRSPFGRHSFIGPNVRALEMLGEKEQAAQSLVLLESALELELTAARSGGDVEARVKIVNQTGHKLPTAYPSRRLWLHLRAVDSNGRVVFESGSPDAPLAGQPHRNQITSPAQAMIWEAEYNDLQGRPTVSLPRAAAYRKDNRILPRGYGPRAGIEPAGVEQDTDFLPGSDTVRYRFPSASPCRITVAVMYQSIKPAHAANLPGFDKLYRNHSAPVQVTAVSSAVN